ncbi:MAG: ABC transporter ATP-binding protein/permease [Myxococcales bacterium FL481]|nr:MAG: ABC transporter ATP-binding protein/permease [Myxococcales bacterium FL481]
MQHFDATTDSTDRNHWNTLKILGHYLWPKDRFDLRMRVVVAMAALALAKVINVVVPLFYKQAVDALSPTAGALTLPLALILAYGGARVLSQAFGELRDLVFARVAQHAQRTIALSTFQHLHRLSLRFHLDRQTGGLSRVIERGTRGIQFLLSFMLFNIVPTLFEILLVTGILFVAFGWAFAIITFVTITAYIVFTLIVTDWRLKYRRTMNQKDSEANTKAIDSLLNYETVKYFGNENHEYRRFDRALAAYETAAVTSQTSLSALNVGQGAIIGIGLVAVMSLAGQGVVDQTLTVGDFVLVNTYLIQLYLPLNFLGFVYREMKQSLVDMDKMFELLDQGIEVRDPANAKPLRPAGGHIEFRDVSFGYDSGRQILDKVSFVVPSGKTVAVVGPSGSGKSTIARLLFRFYDVQDGAILIDGQDIREASQESVRALMGIVPQDTVLFNDTVEYNIRYGRIDADSEDVVSAARLAQIHEFVMAFERQYDTIVGERGLKLSGGEKQRVAIARAILKDPPVLIFDEATSALDSKTEKEIQASLDAVSEQRTTLVIAHRLSTIVDADEILVLKDRQIAERGRHDELLALDGEYALMWARQQEEQPQTHANRASSST